jgi:hypothetical protein
MYRQNVAEIFLKISNAKMQTTFHNYFVQKINAIYKDLSAGSTVCHLPLPILRLPDTSKPVRLTKHCDRITGYQIPATGYQLQATGYQLPATSYQLPATSYQLPATSYQLPATSY